MTSERVKRSTGLDSFVFAQIKDIEVKIKDVILCEHLAVIKFDDIISDLDHVIVVVNMPVDKSVHT